MTPTRLGAAVVRRFARITNSGRLIPEIDGLRFVAISGVVLYHGMQQIAARNGVSASFEAHQGADRAFMWLLNQGRLGVVFFFVISGFVLGLQYSERHHRGRPPPEIKHFYLRRLTRLEPPYMVNLLFSYLVVASLYRFGVRAKGGGFLALLPHLGASMVYLHNLIYHDMSTVNGNTWSLEVEAQFYLLMPLLAGLIYLIRSNAWRAIALLAAIVVHSLIVSAHPDPWYVQFSLVGFLNYFLTGILLADLQSADPHRSGPGHFRWDWAALAVVAGVFASERWLRYEGHFPLLFGVFCLAALRGRILKRCLNFTPVWILGGMCYTIYLYHLMILGLGAQALRFAYRPAFPFWRNFCDLFPLLAVLVLIASVVLFLGLERPCMDRDWPKRLWRRAFGNVSN
jgi:peptidoglycan/LPS O-acetylase OafA/YrhL